jgi:hypothetical protein
MCLQVQLHHRKRKRGMLKEKELITNIIVDNIRSTSGLQLSLIVTNQSLFVQYVTAWLTVQSGNE